ncbi:MAG: extracellular solute-binding protein [Armatimonadota bacterium]|nr:extracellular solute-binding protein [Armatimonadota bacterium]MDR7447773.1 extracellular solute-binding protein [Armatimonadota bacterium]MDR7458552.1 extracellular solute-binding protein [Armatimonadota bacterium]MDR7479893.1 extracellular solute-binding protein [Armatimonadota bacterium]MDR7487759.1 extracellular solute-binding protein [Armatimonadota bacterium]
MSHDERVEEAHGGGKVTRRTFLKVGAGVAGALAGVSTAHRWPAIALQRTKTVRVIAFAQGFAWPELFGPKGTERTEALRALEREVGATIQIEWGDELAVRQKVLTDLMSRTGRYDVVLLGSDGAVQTYGYAGLLEDLERWMRRSPSKYVSLKDIYPKYLEANRVDGVLYGLPYYSFGPGLMYRRDIFRRYGLTPPRTTQQLEATLRTLKERFQQEKVDMFPLTMRGAPGEEPSLDLLGFVYAYAGYPAWFEGGPRTAAEIRRRKAKPIFTGDFKPGFTAFVTLLRNYGSPAASTHTWVDMLNLWDQGKAAVMLPSAINAYPARLGSKIPEVRTESRLAPSPIGPSGKMIQSFWTFSLGLSRFSRNKEEAWQTLAYLTGKKAMEEFSRRTKFPWVTMPSLMYSPTLVETWGREELKVWEDAILKSDPFYFPYFPELNEFMDKIGTAASRAIAGAKIDDVLADLQTFALERMFRAGYYR